MGTRIKEYTVGELAKAAGVTVRLLHHYDAIGLLKPAHVALNGYRIYRHAEALRLQEILFYRAAGMPLQEIKSLLESSAPLDRLSAHRRRLAQDLAKQAAMIASLDRTIAHLKGDEPMTLDDLYKPFSNEKQTEYEEWLIETYGNDMAAAVAKSQAAPDAQPEDFTDIQNEKLKGIEADLVAAFKAGVSPQDADMSAHQNWVSEMWGQGCDAEAYANLSELYLAHPDFIARFETLSEGFSQWLSAAMVAWSKRS